MKRISYFLIICLFVFTGCMRDNNTNNQTTGSSSSSSSMVTTNNTAYNSIDDVMNYLTLNGMDISNMQEIVDLDEGYNAGRRFTYNDATYSLYQYDTNNNDMMNSIQEAKNTNTLSMRVNGEYVDVSVLVMGDYILVYDDDGDLQNFIDLFDNMSRS